MNARRSVEIHGRRVHRVMDFSRAFKLAYGFSPRSYTRATFLEKSKIRQDLMANAGYSFGALPKPANPDRFRVRLRERPASRIGYVSDNE